MTTFSLSSRVWPAPTGTTPIPTTLPSIRWPTACSAASSSALPTILYNYPARSGVEIGFDCLDRVADHPLIVGIKESSGDFSRFLALPPQTRARSDVSSLRRVVHTGAACPVVLESTHMSALEYVDLDDLKAYAVT